MDDSIADYLTGTVGNPSYPAAAIAAMYPLFTIEAPHWHYDMKRSGTAIDYSFANYCTYGGKANWANADVMPTNVRNFFKPGTSRCMKVSVRYSDDPTNIMKGIEAILRYELDDGRAVEFKGYFWLDAMEHLGPVFYSHWQDAAFPRQGDIWEKRLLGGYQSQLSDGYFEIGKDRIGASFHYDKGLRLKIYFPQENQWVRL
jgi:hypothetical protein